MRAVDSGLGWDSLARAMSARPDVLRLAGAQPGAEHDYRSAPWPAEEPDRPFAVYLAENLRYFTLALDLDADGASGRKQRSALRRFLTKAGVSFVEAVSGPAGHCHLISTWPHGISADDAAELGRVLRATAAPDLDISGLSNPRTGCIRPPGAPHRGGGRSEIVGEAATALQVLRQGNPSAAFLRLRQLTGAGPRADRRTRLEDEAVLLALPVVGGERQLPRPRRDLSLSQQQRLRDGDPNATSRSVTAASLAASMACAGWSFAEFLQAVLDHDNMGLEHLRSRRAVGTLRARRDVKQAAQRMWRGRLAWLLANPRECDTRALPPVVDDVANAAGADPARWAGQGGPSERAVLEFLLALARRCGTAAVACDVRTLGLETGVSTSAAHRAIDRLRRAGWLEQLAPGRGRLAATYALQVPRDFKVDLVGLTSGGTLDRRPSPRGTPASLPRPRPTFEVGLAARAHDAMTSSGLGRYAGVLLDLLHRDTSSVTDLVLRSGLRARTVRHHLARLHSAGLATLDHDARWHVDLAFLPQAARHLGTTGAVVARREQIAQDRTTWAWWLADHAAEHGFATRRGLRSLGWSTTRAGVPCPRRPFPVSEDGRRVWTAGAGLVGAGMGPMPEELGLFTSTDPVLNPLHQSKGPATWVLHRRNSNVSREGRGRTALCPRAANDETSMA
ncbi:hypothetical protein SAMN05421756_105279 [Microlunatus flavus]|uniref:Uncharacterized protein n=1 Tax=Microlunatus flavus TaxID=1036181 RepID=A0A1H9IKA9_9ACTN|nr:hypothetical protein SAMN05421756_105279 [Microlunatus flavus]